MKMGQTVCYAELTLWRQGTIFSSIVCLPKECGTISKLIGLRVMIWWLWLDCPEESFLNLSLLKWSSQLGGTYGNSGMIKSLGTLIISSVGGDRALFMTFLCLAIGLSQGLKRICIDGLITYHHEWCCCIDFVLL